MRPSERVSSFFSLILYLVYEEDGAGVPNDAKEKIFTRGFWKNIGDGWVVKR